MRGSVRQILNQFQAEELIPAEAILDAVNVMKKWQRLAMLDHGSTSALRLDTAREMVANMNDYNVADRFFASLMLQGADGPMDFMAIRAAHFVRCSHTSLKPLLLRVPVGTLPDLQFSVRADFSPKGGPFVLASHGFQGSLSRVVDWCLPAVPYWGRPQITPLEAGKGIRATLSWKICSTVFPEKPTLRSRQWAKGIALGNWYDSALNFALAHEYAHILDRLGCLKTSKGHVEFAADAVGAQIALDVARRLWNTHGSLRGALVGMELILQILRIREEVGLAQISTSHPRATERLQRIHSYIEERFGVRTLEYLKPLREIFDHACEAGDKVGGGP